MNNQALDRLLAGVAAACSLLVATIVVVSLVTGGSQDYFQIARSAEAFAAYVQTPGVAEGVRVTLGFDGMFLILYVVFFILLTVRLRGVLEPVVLNVALVAMLLTACLDALENHHIIAMLHSIQHGLPVSAGESQVQMIASSFKFHLGYAALGLFALGYFRLSGFGRLVAIGLWLYVPLGVLIFVWPADSAGPLVLARTLFFSAGFALSAILFLGLAKADGRNPTTRGGAVRIVEGP